MRFKLKKIFIKLVRSLEKAGRARAQFYIKNYKL